MLYSLEAMISYERLAIYPEDRWRLLGAIEAVNGLLLFDLTTAFSLRRHLRRLAASDPVMKGL